MNSPKDSVMPCVIVPDHYHLWEDLIWTTFHWLDYFNCPQASSQPDQVLVLMTHPCDSHCHPGLLGSSVLIWYSVCLSNLGTAASSHRTCIGW